MVEDREVCQSDEQACTATIVAGEIQKVIDDLGCDLESCLRLGMRRRRAVLAQNAGFDDGLELC